jgi:hypothetical protein
MHTIAIAPERWAMAIPLLTLDHVLPLFSAMGFDPSDPGRLQQTLRSQMIRARHGFAQTGFRVPVAADTMASAIVAELGQPDGAQLASWIARVFHSDPTDARDLRQWTTLLRQCRRDRVKWRVLFPDIRHESEILERFLQSIDIDAFEKQYDDCTGRPLTDWDLHLYAVFHYDDDDEADTPSGPHLWLAPTVREYQGYRFWSWLGQSLSRAKLLDLQRCATDLAREEGLLGSESMADPELLVSWL